MWGCLWGCLWAAFDDDDDDDDDDDENFDFFGTLTLQISIFSRPDGRTDVTIGLSMPNYPLACQGFVLIGPSQPRK